MAEYEHDSRPAPYIGVTRRHVGRVVGKSNNVFRISVEFRHLAWQEQAVCTSIDPESFFPEGAVDRKVLGVCRRCPVITECLQHALDNPELAGVWAATTAEERKRIRAKAS